jgi:oligosaccharide reducing-end xylanase
VLLISLGCQRTLDNLGYDDIIEAGHNGISDAGHNGISDAGHNDVVDAGRPELKPLLGPLEYPNAFRDVLNKSDDEIARKLENAWNTVFHGNPSDYAIYFPLDGGDQACIKDIYHNEEVRTEGMGLGMVIAVEFNKRYEFDQLWRYAKQNLMIRNGSARGYFASHCDSGIDSDAESRVCLDPYGLQQFTMALILANDRWGASIDDIDYNADAWMLLDVMRNKVKENGGIVDNITNTFDEEKLLVFDEPKVTSFNYTRLANEMPAYYEMWAQATGDTFWTSAAANARNFWGSVANQNTGLLPVRAYFTGNEFVNWNVFAPEAYRIQVNMSLDQIWTVTATAPNAPTWNQGEADLLINFFAKILATGASNYAMSYELDGTVIDSTAADASLISTNGVSALIAPSTNTNRKAFIQAVWDLQPPSGKNRYYSGLMYLVSVLMLSGEFKVY